MLRNWFAGSCSGLNRTGSFAAVPTGIVNLRSPCSTNGFPGVKNFPGTRHWQRSRHAISAAHTPATLQDFVWWSGLSLSEARRAVGSIHADLETGRFGGNELLVHRYWCGSRDPRTGGRAAGEVLHLLPPYDEYLISYKERGEVLSERHRSKAFNRWGIFYPVILHNGHIVGNWKPATGKRKGICETSFFDPKYYFDPVLLDHAVKRYGEFTGKRG